MNSSSTASITLELIVGDRMDIKKYINPFKSHFIRLMQAVRLTCGTYAEPYLYGYSGGGVGK